MFENQKKYNKNEFQAERMFVTLFSGDFCSSLPIIFLRVDRNVRELGIDNREDSRVRFNL